MNQSSAAVLALIGATEAVVYLIRVRTAVQRCPWRSAASSFSVAVTRVWFVVAGASAVMADANLIQLVFAYALTATAATAGLHWFLERGK